MKKTLLMAAMICSAGAFAQIRIPAPSTTQTITQAFGLGTIKLTYSRPNIRGRVVFKENSELAPLGKLWRFGANAATRISFTDPVMVGGKLLDTGSYVLYAKPGKEYWDIIFNKGLTNSGTDGYKESEDVVTVRVKAEKLGMEIETFTMQFGDIRSESCELQAYWSNTAVRVPMSSNIKDRIRAQVEKTLSADKVEPGNYQAAATFYYEWDKDLNKALVNISKAADANPKGYWLFLMKARIQKDMGDKAGAKASAEKTIEVATEAKNDDYVRQANELLKKL
ncbi:DUF2911 domain-containing protein [Sediminibacterium soli]|uniref:DUF2911 domain-containing protein n=1 Tax=Sediminibacterium soli TaxID=2698829 RepID=UPI00137A6A4D|nr:DUF2911 domain-containing protein [Sediminibacterium soli]NCI45996.1 DUF2911 domain-containing protein [Sediminibacterium soli]